MNKRIFSLLLAACMVFGTVPTTAFATQNNGMITTSNVTEEVTPCENHKIHDENCSYIEAVTAQPCSHLKEDGSYSCAPVKENENVTTPDSPEQEYTCDHSDNCGYVQAIEGADCNHACELCLADDAHKEIIPDPCICEVLCIDSPMNPDCTICTSEGADLVALCKGTAAVMMIQPRGTVTSVSSAGALNTAISNATGGMEFQLQSGFLSDALVVIPQGKSFDFTIDLNGQTLTASSDNTITHNGSGKLTINDTATGGTIENTHSAGYAIYGASGDIAVNSGSPVIKSNGTAINKAPVLSGYNPSVKVTASTSFDGSSPVDSYDSTAIATYKYLTFAKGAELVTANITIASLNNISCTFKVLTAAGADGTGGTVQVGDGSVAAIHTIAPGSLILPDTITGSDGKTYKVTAIGQNAFSECTSISGVIIPSGVTDIGQNAFSKCVSLSRVIIPSSVTNIGDNAFKGCLAIYAVTFVGATPPTTIGTDAFMDPFREYLKICVPQGAGTAYKTQMPDYASAILELEGYSYNNTNKTLTITSNNGTIAWRGDPNNSNIIGTITTVVIDSGVTSIESPAFLECENLTNVTIPEGVTTIGNNAFRSCRTLPSISIPNSVTQIGQDAFSACFELTSVQIPSGVTTIGTCAFAHCDKLTSVTFEGTTPPTTFDSDVFRNNASDLKIYVPASAVNVYKGVANLSPWENRIEATITATVTFDANGGTVTPASATTDSSGKLSTLPTPTHSGSYRFDGWFTAANGGTAVTTDIIFTANTTIYAHWTYTGGGSTGDGSTGGGSTGGGSSSDDTTTTAPTKPPQTVTGNIENKATVDNKGNVVVNVTDKNISDAVANAKTQAQQKGAAVGEISAVIHVTSPTNSNPNSVTINLPKTVQDQIIKNKIDILAFIIDKPDISMRMNLNAVTEMNKQAKSSVQLSATRTDASKVSTEAKNAIGNRLAFNLTASYNNGKKNVTNFGSGTISVGIPYTPQKNENPNNLCAVYVDNNGKASYLSTSAYDVKAKALRFTTNHFSTYGVGYKADVSTFTDTTNHWAKDDILFVTNRGLLSGTSNTLFSPNTAMTRGMFVTALGRLANVDVTRYKKSSFGDVKSDSYYMGYIEWASKNGIASGSNGKFMPDQAMTREQMAVMLKNYVKTTNFTLPNVHVENKFADNSKISNSTKVSVKSLQMAGILIGKSGNLFDPQGTPTRGEVSAVLHRFVKVLVGTNNSQGWTMNDSGKWMYYQNGKPVTGKKAIDGVTYTFNTKGEVTDLPKNMGYNTHTVAKDESWGLIAAKYGCSTSELLKINNKSISDVIHPGQVLKVPQK